MKPSNATWHSTISTLVDLGLSEATIRDIEPDKFLPRRQMNPIASNSLRLYHEFLRAEYLTNSFDCHDWRKLPNNSLVLYDDNLDYFVRLQPASEAGTKQVAVKDDDPPRRGDWHSVTKLSAATGFPFTVPSSIHGSEIQQRARAQSASGGEPPNEEQQGSVLSIVITHSDCPPVVRPSAAGCNGLTDTAYPTPEVRIGNDDLRVSDFPVADARHGTWTAYARLHAGVLAKRT